MQEEIVESKLKLEEFLHKSQFPKTQERRYKNSHEKACQTGGYSSSTMSKSTANKAKTKDAQVETDPIANNVSEVTTPIENLRSNLNKSPTQPLPKSPSKPSPQRIPKQQVQPE